MKLEHFLNISIFKLLFIFYVQACDCEPGYKGDYCEELDCPGMFYKIISLHCFNEIDIIEAGYY